MDGGGKTIIASGATLTLSGGGNKGLTRTLDNAGTVHYPGTGLYFGYGQAVATTFNNLAGGVCNVTGEGNFSQFNAAAHVFNNAGTFHKSGADSTTTFSGVTFTNTGTVEIQSGTLQCDSGFTQSSGRTTLAGGNFTSIVLIEILGGTLGGIGIVTGDVTSSGNLSPGASPGLLTISGNYTQAGGGALSIEVAGLISGTNFDRLAVSGTASLAGALNLTLTNGFYPPTNANFSFLTAATRLGAFDTFNYPSNEVGMQVDYTTINASAQVINVRPGLPLFASQTNNELVLFNLNAAGTDADQPPQTLSYALTNSPLGATIGAGSGLISWLPTEAQGPLTTNITVLVTDNGTPNLTVARTFQITVNEINVPPGLTLPPSQSINEQVPFTATATATDSDVPTNTWAFELVSGPSTLTVGPSGAIAWTPDENQGPGNYTVTVRVTDTNTNAVNEQHLSTTNSFTLTVREVNRPPVLTVPTNQVLLEETALSVSASATDPDLPANMVTFALLSPPTGMTINPNSGAINWIPGEAQGSNAYTITVVATDNSPDAVNAQHLSVTNSFTVTVNESNRPPVLTVPTNQVIDELTTLAVSASATDPDLPANSLAFSLASAPSGMTIDTNTGAITWVPTEAQGPSSNFVVVVVTDLNPNAVNAQRLSTTNSFSVWVNEVNVATLLFVPTNQVMDELMTLNVSASATDADEPANSLAFSLALSPSGMTIGTNTGAITWTPTEAQGPSSNFVMVVVTDLNPNAVNTQQLSTTNSFSVWVNEVNVAPVVGALADYARNPGQTISFTATATDADRPANGLSFSLVNPPAGATISSGGAFSWRPTVAPAATTQQVFVRVQDDGSPVLRGTNSFTVVVNPLAPVVLTPMGLAGGQFRLAVSGTAGPDYVLLASTNLINWVDLATNLAPIPPFKFTDPDAGTFPHRSYRVRLSP